LGEQCTKTDYREYLARHTLPRLGVTSGLYVPLPPRLWSEVSSRLGTNVGLDGPSPCPLLSERARWVACDWNPAYGGYSSARAMAAFYAGVLRAIRNAPAGTRAHVLDRFTRPARPRALDLAFGYECRFGLGFMVDLRDHSFGQRVGTAAFGHSGNAGTSFALADPAADLVACVHFNAVIAADVAVRQRRPALVDALYADLEDPSPAPEARA